jgi:hypothetical protein
MSWNIFHGWLCASTSWLQNRPVLRPGWMLSERVTGIEPAWASWEVSDLLILADQAQQVPLQWR